MSSENLPIPQVEITTLARQFPILNPESAAEVKEIIQANSGPRGINPREMDRIKVPLGGIMSWTVPGPDGEDMIKELSGIVLAKEDNRVYYKTAFAERGKKAGPPDCLSRDTFFGVGDPGGECASCPNAEWGSDPKGGRGQACKEVRRILLLRPDQILPVLISIPATSLKNARQYFNRLTNYRIPYWGLITHLRLERVENADGVPYSRAVFTSGPRLNQAEREMLATYQEQMATLLGKTTIETTDYEVGSADDE